MAKLRYSVPDTPHIFSRLNVSTDGMKLVFVKLSPGDEHIQFTAITTNCNNPKPILQQVINTSLPDSPRRTDNQCDAVCGSILGVSRSGEERH
ncbi:hypothetical protein NUBL21976_26820 [Klebsiella pneumoniae]|nr:hypothetical protein NUBL21976_26820 [Klebsiella pneumoniae]